MRGGLAKVGEPSLLDGSPCGNVSLQRSVELATGSDSTAADNYVGQFDVVTIDSRFEPQVGALLQHPDGEFKLDKLVHDNGAVRQFIVTEA